MRGDPAAGTAVPGLRPPADGARPPSGLRIVIMTDVLKGVQVVELSTVITAPLTGLMLADLGAEVIKVEHPQGGDPFRTFRGGQYSPNFVAYNRGKRSIQLDLRTEAGRAILLALLARADVLLENYRPGIMAKLGLGDRRARRRQSQADPLLDHRLRRDRALQRTPGLRQCRGGAQRHIEPATRSATSAVERADHRRQRHRDVRLLRHPRRALRARAHRPRPPDRGEHAGGRHCLHPGSVRELHPGGDRERPVDPGGGLAIVRVPLQRRQAHRHPPVVAAEILRRARRRARASRPAARMCGLPTAICGSGTTASSAASWPRSLSPDRGSTG